MNRSAYLRCLAWACVVLGAATLLPDYFPATRDFVEYYSAARVLVEHGDPYDGLQLLPIQRELLQEPNKDTVLSLWTPPWTLAVYLPFGLLPFGTAHFCWLFVQMFCTAWAVEMWWRTQHGSTESLPLAYLVMLAFAPIFWNLHFGQNTGFLLLGIAGINHHLQRQQPYRAGMFLALTAIKPHLLAVVGVWALCAAWKAPGRKTLAVGVAALIVAACVPVFFRATIFSDYLAALRRPPSPETVTLKEWAVPLASFYIRIKIDENAFWIQFVPCLVTGVLSAGYFIWLRRRWDWREELPLGVVVSALVAPYGGWIFDLTILLVVALDIARRSLAFPRATMNSLLLILLLVSLWNYRKLSLEDYWFLTPSLLCLWLATVILSRAAQRTK